MSITDELRGWANGFAMTRKHYELCDEEIIEQFAAKLQLREDA